MNPETDINLLQEKFDILFQESLDMILIINEEYQIYEANILACRYLGLTLKNMRKKKFTNFIEMSTIFKSFCDDVRASGKGIERFHIKTTEKMLIPFDISARLIKVKEEVLLVLICRDVFQIVDSENRGQMLNSLLRHDLLNKMHAEIGYLDMIKRLYEMDKLDANTFDQIHLRMRDVTVKSIYLIQNAKILGIMDTKPLVNQKIADIMNHAIRYIQNFFASSISIEINNMNNYVVAGDEYIYRVFVNLMIKMLEYTTKSIVVEINVHAPTMEEARIVLHIEGVQLSLDEKREIISSNEIENKKIDIVVIDNLLERYRMKLKLQDINRGGKVKGIRMIFKVPVVEWEV
ncbi:MAG: PAS domain-containing protein [Candidatus Heimdallarchaeota archaeon]|nr:PAS domain-containing protein [Candidatus Heimdallarchaeota archaeon]